MAKKHKIFIDGQAGTTGLDIFRRLQNREDIEIIQIETDLRKDENAKRKCIEAADLMIICLPDEEAKKSVRLAQINPNLKIIDASTAHRVDESWVYGLVEMNENQRAIIANSRYIANPGCYPTGVILLLKSLIEEKIIDNYPIVIDAVSGYSGGGKKLIEQYQATQKNSEVYAPYAMEFKHKHIPEMMYYAGLDNKPFFQPAVVNYDRGMMIKIALHKALLNTNSKSVHQILKERYASEKLVIVAEQNHQIKLQDGFLHFQKYAGLDQIELFVFESDEFIELIALYDNLGKGAAGACIQNMNILLGRNELHGLFLIK